MAKAAKAKVLTTWPPINPEWNIATQLRVYFDHLPEAQQLCLLAFAEVLCKRYAYDAALGAYNKRISQDTLIDDDD